MTAATSGNGNLVFGDNTGNVHLVNRTYDVTTFRAYEITLTLAQQVQHSTFLFTIGVSSVVESFHVPYKYHCYFHENCVRLGRRAGLQSHDKSLELGETGHSDVRSYK